MDSPLILNVNDHEQSRYLGTRTLKGAGFRVIEAADGETALRLLQEKPDLVLLDVKLPDMSGVQVARMIKSSAATRHIVVLQTSATYITAERRVESLQNGSDGYLVAPYEPEELIAQVNALLRLSRAEAALRDQAVFLAEANIRKDEFLAMLAHELRNPLAAIRSGLPLLEVHREDPERHASIKDMMDRQVINLARMVDDLLEVSRVTRGKIHLQKRVVELTAIVKQAVQALTTQIDARNQELRITLPSAPIHCDADPTRLEQVFTNLLDNASKYSAAGKRIELTVAAHDGHAVVKISDEGMGITPEALPHIFELFVQDRQTLDRARGGMGIGLTLVKTLVELHQGTVIATSGGIGKGTTMEVRLPRVVSASPSPPRVSLLKSPPKTKPRRIALIEDNLEARDALQEVLELLGHTVQVAGDGEEGVELVRSMKPDVVLSDIGLPRLDGYGMAKRIRALEDGHAPYMVALTGYGGPEQRDRALDAGFDLHLVKPVDPGALARLFAEI